MTDYKPEGYHSITPCLVVKDADALLTFTKKALGAEEKFCMRGQNGRVVHAEIQIGDSRIMLGEPMGPENPPTTATLYIYVPDCDKSYQQAVSAGGQSVSEPKDMFYGDRTATVKDSFGNSWCFGTHKEDVSEEELKRRGREFETKMRAKAA